MSDPSTRPLEPKDYSALLDGLMHLPMGDFGGQVVETILRTGMHPVALGNPTQWAVKLQDDGQLAWCRPKTKTVVYVPVPVGVRSFLPALLEQFRKRPMHPVNINKLVHVTCARFGMGWVSPRALRHTFGMRVWLKFHDINIVMQWMGCTTEVALGYIKSEMTDQKNTILTEGWE